MIKKRKNTKLPINIQTICGTDWKNVFSINKVTLLYAYISTILGLQLHFNQYSYTIRDA